VYYYSQVQGNGKHRPDALQKHFDILLHDFEHIDLVFVFRNELLDR
jgi:hypothetical protein